MLRILVLILAGSIGFVIVERWSFLDSLYMTVTTLATVGYGEVHPLTTAGKVFAILLILVGVGLFLFILSDMGQIFLEANPTAIFGRDRMKRKIAKLTGHQIVCGFGRTGQEAADHFHHNQVPFVIIEADPKLAKACEQDGHLVLQGDATSEETLHAAHIDTAAGIVCCLPDDTNNTFIALCARGLNESITIVCRASNPGSDSIMRRAGAHMVISPYEICGRRMATAVTHPLVLEFLDVVMHSAAYDLRLEQVSIGTKSGLVGRNLKDASIKQNTGAMVLAINQSGKLITNPAPETVFNPGDELIALGAEQELDKLEVLAGTKESRG